MAFAAALGAVVSSSCVLELNHDIACGDGFVDLLAGEECDPGDPGSFADGCVGTSRPGGDAACDPTDCVLIATIAQCTACGDGIVDTEFDEECDGDNLSGATCPFELGSLSCASDCTYDFSACETCGNGEVEDDEECDFNASGDLVSRRPCAGANIGEPDEIPPLLSPFKPYTSGETATCRRDDCMYDRLSCGYCGNGVRDDMSPVDFDGSSIPAEWCDAGSFDEDRLLEVYGNFCTDESDRPNVGCGADCRSFVERFDDARCCRRKSEICPDGGPIKCCYEFDNPGEEPCDEEFLGGMLIRNICL